ncbi:hypothetical protein DFQ30_005490 [Apophysomyces sp. BC1015]|nr:hypothetical protein DFQ30_005490 [Apophysomyces sp. BC1015]KAG0179136.1 hypothetical protein DFQ29_002472 [Apophysomyces sp. BC1021]
MFLVNRVQQIGFDQETCIYEQSDTRTSTSQEANVVDAVMACEEELRDLRELTMNANDYDTSAIIGTGPLGAGYGQRKHNNTNVEKLKERIKDMDDIDVCYEIDPLHPILLPLVKICSNPYLYKKYTSDCHIVQFLNEVFLPTDPLNEAVYVKKHVSIKDILSKMVQRLFQTSLVDKVFVSFSSSTNDPIVSRDSIAEDDRMLQMGHVEGNTQGT